MMTENKQMIVKVVKFFIENILISFFLILMFMFSMFTIFIPAVASLLVYFLVSFFIVPIKYTLLVSFFSSNELYNYFLKYKLFFLFFLIFDIVLFINLPYEEYYFASFIFMVTPSLVLYALINKMKETVKIKIFKSVIKFFFFILNVLASFILIIFLANGGVFKEEHDVLSFVVLFFLAFVVTVLEYIFSNLLYVYLKFIDLNNIKESFRNEKLKIIKSLSFSLLINLIIIISIYTSLKLAEG